VHQAQMQSASALVVDAFARFESSPPARILSHLSPGGDISCHAPSRATARVA